MFASFTTGGSTCITSATLLSFDHGAVGDEGDHPAPAAAVADEHVLAKDALEHSAHGIFASRWRGSDSAEGGLRSTGTPRFGFDQATGFARRALDNVGVQYGLGAFNAGKISAGNSSSSTGASAGLTSMETW